MRAGRPARALRGECARVDAAIRREKFVTLQSVRRKRRRCDSRAAVVNNHPRLRAREDGENPSPPRDCKAEKFAGARH